MLNKKILIFSLSYYPLVGGAEVAIKEITSRIKDVEFDMITLRFNKDHKEFEKVGNVDVYRVGFGSSYLNKILFIPLASFKAWRLNREKKYKKFWVMMTYMLFPVTLMRLFGNKTPYVLTLQDGDPFEHVFKRPHVKLFAPLLKKGFKEAEVVQPISNFLASWVRKFGSRSRVEVIPNGVDLKKFTRPDFPAHGREGNSRENLVRLVTTSRLVKKNGLEDLIESLKYLPPNVCLKIVGSGPLDSRLKSKSRKLNLEDRVEFVGHVSHSDVVRHLWKADIFIRPSLSEGMGVSFIEAMAVGLPVVATPVGGIPDFLSDPDKSPQRPPTGLYVAPRDSKSIAKQVERLMKNDRLKETLITNGKRLVKDKYDWDLIAEEMKGRVFGKV